MGWFNHQLEFRGKKIKTTKDSELLDVLESCASLQKRFPSLNKPAKDENGLNLQDTKSSFGRIEVDRGIHRDVCDSRVCWRLAAHMENGTNPIYRNIYL